MRPTPSQINKQRDQLVKTFLIITRQTGTRQSSPTIHKITKKIRALQQCSKQIQTPITLVTELITHQAMETTWH